MLRRGASLAQIGEVLRHQLAQTTEIYAKVDLAALRRAGSTLARRCAMKSLASHLESYLDLRHRLGFKLRLAGGLLRRFVRFAQQKKASIHYHEAGVGMGHPTRPIANRRSGPIAWAWYAALPSTSAAVDPRTEVPPQELLPHRYHRNPPYLYSDKEIRKLIQTARQLPAPNDLRAISNATLFGLLAVTGMRVGEAIDLDREDVDLHRGCSPFARPSSTNHDWFRSTSPLGTNSENMKRLRDECCRHPKSPSFFLSERGTRLNDFTVRRWFVIASRKIGLRGPTDRRGPRIHDLRHHFAHKTILNGIGGASTSKRTCRS